MSTTVVPTLPILERIRDVEGWLTWPEADLLAACAQSALHDSNGEAGLIVEVGSWCGRSTIIVASVAQLLGGHVWAIDPHEGEVGAADSGVQQTGSTAQRFQHNIQAAGLTDVVTPVVLRSYQVRWDSRIALLLIDGLHDYD